MKRMSEAAPTITLPPGTPLIADTARASELFGLSASTLYRLRHSNPGFRALTIKSGKEVLYDIPRLYAWFAGYLGSELDYRAAQ